MNNQNINQLITDKLLVVSEVIHNIDGSTDENVIKQACDHSKIDVNEFKRIFNFIKKTVCSTNERSLSALKDSNRISTVVYGKLKHDFETIDDFGKMEFTELCYLIKSRLSTMSVIVILSLMVEYNVRTVDMDVDEIKQAIHFIQIIA